MEQSIVYITLAFIGLCMGSFAGATVWRLRALQLVKDKANGEVVDKNEHKQLLLLSKSAFVNDRSRCLHCGHELAWYDLLPLASWVMLGGKCRYCKKKIGWFEPTIELGSAIFFVLSYLAWPLSLQTPIEIAQFVLWLVAGVLLIILFAYDLKWFLLPNYVVFPLIGITFVSALLHMSSSTDIATSLINIFASIMILSGLYGLLWLVSKGQWIGFGDVKLGLALGLLLSDWQLAFIALFVANVVGSLVVIPAMLAGKVTRKTRVPFGPFLIVGTVISAWFGYNIINLYFSTFL